MAKITRKPKRDTSDWFEPEAGDDFVFVQGKRSYEERKADRGDSDERVTDPLGAIDKSLFPEDSEFGYQDGETLQE